MSEGFYKIPAAIIVNPIAKVYELIFYSLSIAPNSSLWRSSGAKNVTYWFIAFL